jgi:hypothetical protein
MITMGPIRQTLALNRRSRTPSSLLFGQLYAVYTDSGCCIAYHRYHDIID